MTRGTASPSHDPEPQTSGVPPTRPTFASRGSGGGVTGGPTFSKLLVVFLVGLFVLASAAFIVSALNSPDKEPSLAPIASAAPA